VIVRNRLPADKPTTAKTQPTPTCKSIPCLTITLHLTSYTLLLGMQIDSQPQSDTSNYTNNYLFNDSSSFNGNEKYAHNSLHSTKLNIRNVMDGWMDGEPLTN
jgi:hypothetical protein